MEKTGLDSRRLLLIGGAATIIFMALFAGYRYVSAHNVYTSAIHKAEDGHLKEAEQGYRKAIALNPWHADAHFELASLLKKKGKIDESLALMERAVALNGDEADYHLGIGFLYFNDLKNYKRAKEHFEAAYVLDQGNHFACYMLARVSENQKDFDAAIDYYKKTIEVNPKMTTAYKQLACVYEVRGMDEKARSCWEDVLKLAPGDAEATTYLNASADTR